MGRHAAPLGHIKLIQSQPVFHLTTLCSVLIRVAANTFSIAAIARIHFEKWWGVQSYIFDAPPIFA